MDARYGAWAQLLALFRLIHDGGGHGDLRFPAAARAALRSGRLSVPRRPAARQPPRAWASASIRRACSDGVVFRVLQNLLILDGERLSYRALDVEQIGSVYEAMMGFALQQAAGPSIAVTPKHIVVNLARAAGAEAEGARRVAAEAGRAEAHRRRARQGRDGGRRRWRRSGRRCRAYTPHVAAGRRACICSRPRSAAGPARTTRRARSPSRSSARRSGRSSSGSASRPRRSRFSTSRSATRRWGPARSSSRRAACSPSASCARGRCTRQTPKVPDDEDVLTYARRLVAERCLYGVDKNIFAVDLAKLSLWLATLAREHPFTFLDHALRHGDSLVGLSREQIACFNWEATKQLPLLRDAHRRARGRGAAPARADSGAGDVGRRAGEGAAAAGSGRGAGRRAPHWRPRRVGVLRAGEAEGAAGAASRVCAAEVEQWLGAARVRRSVAGPAQDRSERPLTFHWEIEFPEVFTRANAGFDAFVGNPPFAGKNTISELERRELPAAGCWQLHEESHGNADLVAHFYRRAFNLLRERRRVRSDRHQHHRAGRHAEHRPALDLPHDGHHLRGTQARQVARRGSRRRLRRPCQQRDLAAAVRAGRPASRAHHGVSVSRRRRRRPGGAAGERGQELSRAACLLGMGFTFDDTDKKGVANPIALMQRADCEGSDETRAHLPVHRRRRGQRQPDACAPSVTSSTSAR